MGVRSFVKHSALLALTVGSSHGIRIIQSNDDGWAELNIREFHDMLIDAGHDAVVSAPAENMSGKGTVQTPITIVPSTSPLTAPRHADPLYHRFQR